MYISENGCAFADRLDFWCFVVEKVKDESIALDIPHDDVIDTDLLYHAATAARCFQPDTGIGAVEDAVWNGNPFYTARHFTSYYYTAVSRKHDTVGNRNVFTSFPVFASVGISTRFDGDAIISYTDETIWDAYIAAGGGIDAIGVGTFGIFIRVFNGNTVNYDIIAKCRIDGPKWRVDDFYVFDENVGTLKKLNKRRAEHTTF